MIVLPVKADDKHRTTVAIAGGLIGGEGRCFPALGCSVANALAEAAMTELVCAAKEFNAIVGVVGSQYRLHGAVMLVAKGQKVRPHAKRV